MAATLTRQELERAYCWEAEDNRPRQPAMTEFRHRRRYHQAQWREAKGHPIGSHPIAPRAGAPTRPVGSRMPIDYPQAWERKRAERAGPAIHETDPEFVAGMQEGRQLGVWDAARIALGEDA